MSAPEVRIALTEVARFGQMTERENEIATVAARQGYAKGWEGGAKAGVEVAPEVAPEQLLAFVKNLDVKTVARFAPDLFNEILRKGWDLAIEKKAAGTKGVSGMLTLKEVKELAEALRGPDVKLDFPDQPAITVNNHMTPDEDIAVQFEDGLEKSVTLEATADGGYVIRKK